MTQIIKRLTISKNKAREIFTYNTPLAPCTRMYNLSCWSQKNNAWHIKDTQYCLDKDNHYFCALCSLYYLDSFSLSSIKIIGRGFVTEKKVLDLRLIKSFRDLIKRGVVDESNFLSEGQKIYSEIYGKKCLPRECHHPEIYRLRPAKYEI